VQADFSIRGGSFGQTLVLLDGIRSTMRSPGITTAIVRVLSGAVRVLSVDVSPGIGWTKRHARRSYAVVDARTLALRGYSSGALDTYDEQYLSKAWVSCRAIDSAVWFSI
jgi:hypothetical protein